MPIFEIGGRRMHYLDEGRGEAILFGHSYLWDHRMWEAQVAEFSKTHRCIVPDLWGHGKSGPLGEESYDLGCLAEDYRVLMEHLGIDEFSIVGLSVGGMWGVELVLRYPMRIRALVLMNTFIGAEPGHLKTLYFKMLDTMAGLDTIPTAMIDQLVPIFLGSVTIAGNPKLADALRAGLAAFTAEQIPTVVAMGRIIFSREDRLGQAGSLMVPTWVIAGERDKPHPVSDARKMVAAIQGAQLEIIAEAGHITAREQPESVNIILRRVFGRST